MEDLSVKKSIVVFFVVFVSVFLSLSTLHSFLGQVQAQNIPAIDRQQSLPIEMIHQQGGSTYDVALQGDYAFVGVGPRLLILNVADAANPVLVGKTDVFSGVVTNVTVENQHVYLSAGGDFAIVDVQNGASPVVTAVYDMPGYARGIAISGTTAFVAEAWYWYGGQYHGGGLYAFDISNPANPSLLDHFETSASASDVALAGSYAYVTIEYSDTTPGPGTFVIDVSNPGSLSQANLFPTPLADGVTAAGNVLYVAAQDYGVGIFDITQPTTPVLLTVHSGAFWARDIAVVGNRAYIAGSTAGLRILDVTTPASPLDLGSYGVSGLARVLKVAVDGNQAYVAYDPVGLHVVDVTDSMNPVETAVYNPTGWVGSVAKSGNLLYAAEAENGIRIYNVSSPYSPTEIGFYPKTAVSLLTVKNNYAYFVNSMGLHILDVSNTDAVTETGSLALSDWPRGLQVIPNYAYLAIGGDGMRIIDIASPTTPVEVGAFADEPGIDNVDYVSDLTISGTLAYLADSDNGLKIVDISNVTDPSELGAIDVGYIENVEVYSHYAYAFDWQNLYVVDVSNPATPAAVITQTVSDDSIRSTLFTDGYLYVTEEGGGMRILDLANPAAPVEVFATDLAGYTWDVAVDNGTVYVAAAEAGFYVFGNPITFTDFIYLPAVLRGS